MPQRLASSLATNFPLSLSLMSSNVKPVGAAVQVLINQVMGRLNAEVEQLAAVALKDAGLDPAEGWRFDFFNAQYVQQEPASEAKE